MTTSRRRSRAARSLATAALAIAPVLAPAAGAADPADPRPTTQRDDIGPTSSAGPDDPLRAAGTDVVTSLEDLSAQVQAQVAAVVAARAAEAAAAAELAQADAVVAATQAVIDDLTSQSDEVVIESFINPPVESAMDTLTAHSLTDATVKQSILTSQSNATADVLTRLEAARDDLDTVKAEQADAADVAEDRADDAEQALTDLVASQSEESTFVIAVQDRLAARLAEADALDGIDPAAAEAMRAREAELVQTINGIVAAREQRAAEAALQQAMAEAAARAEAEAAQRASRASPSRGGSVGPATGNLTSVSCPGGGSITVDSSLAGSLSSMLDAAAADGLNMCGGGYRDPSEQIALREANCGSSYYAIYEAPSSSCSPPTARPGTSNHEQGLAIDFNCNGGGALSSSSPCFRWLENNAAGYGFYNLPSEPWHWSNDGT